MPPTHVLFFDPGIINMAYCLIQIRDLKIQKWGLISIKDSTHEGSCTKLARHLDELDLTGGLENVIIVIEQQPRTNIKTIIISGQLQMYYVLNKIEQTVPNINKIVGYHAKHKLTYYVPRPGDAPMPENIGKLKNGHYKNKKTAVEHCRRVLQHNGETEEWINFFEKSKKKDDIGDSILGALSYIQKSNLSACADEQKRPNTNKSL